MDRSPPGSSVHGIFQARILEWIVISFSRESCRHRNHTQVSCIDWAMTKWHIGVAHEVHQRHLYIQGKWWLIVTPYKTEKEIFYSKELPDLCQKEKNWSLWLDGYFCHCGGGVCWGIIQIRDTSQREGRKLKWAEKIVLFKFFLSCLEVNFSWLHHVTCRIFPDQESNLCPLHWKCRISTTRAPGKSLRWEFLSHH